LSGLPAAAPEFGDEDEAYRFLALADETARALRKAVELCARAEQSSGGLSIKLAQRGFSRNAVSAALTMLMERGILDDRRYAALWARHRAERKGEGPAAVAVELRARGFHADDIRVALAEIDFGPALAKAVKKETVKLAALLRKRGRGDGDESGAMGDILRDSLRRNLRKQGFDSDLIREEIDKLK
jgi:SOS response regulatory protein OraA/RecX